MASLVRFMSSSVINAFKRDPSAQMSLPAQPTSPTKSSLLWLLDQKQEYASDTEEAYEIVIPFDLFRNDSDLWDSKELIELLKEFMAPMDQ